MANRHLVVLVSPGPKRARNAPIFLMAAFLLLLAVFVPIAAAGHLGTGLAWVSPMPADPTPSTPAAIIPPAITNAPAEPRSGLPTNAAGYPTYFPTVHKEWCDTPVFQFSNNRLAVNTPATLMVIEGGAIVYVQDKASGEILLSADAYAGRPSGASSFVGFISQDQESSLYVRRPVRSSKILFTPACIAGQAARLVYSSLDDLGTPSASKLVVDVTVDAASGEIIVQLMGIEADSNLYPSSIDMPIMNMTTPAVILGSGARYVRADTDASDRSSYSDLGLYAPTMAVVEGTSSTLAVWSESTALAPEYIRMEHKLAYDQLVLHAAQDPKQTDRQRIVSPPWRIGTYPTWATAARRWRQTFEARTGARPLWENGTPWVRDVHAVFDSTNQSDMSPADYRTLAGLAAPEKVLFFLWNGDRIVLHGDHTLVAQVGRPAPALISTVKTYGWPFMLFHPYDLMYSVSGEAQRLRMLEQKGWLPAGYRFNPDYEGTPQNWRSYWADISAGYPGGVFDAMHPGSTEFRSYLVRNIRDYCALYQADGVYLDTSGDNGDAVFAAGPRVVDGQDYALGEVNALAQLNGTLPYLAYMSEYQPWWLLPYAFYSWEGTTTHLQQSAAAPTRLNHPLRVALTGSYAWTRESNAAPGDDVSAALLGTLPEISLTGAYGVGPETALWSQKRAQLFTEEELFNDLPDKWSTDALAYYRSKSGNWFKFKLLGATYGYVEILPDGEEIVRLQR